MVLVVSLFHWMSVHQQKRYSSDAEEPVQDLPALAVPCGLVSIWISVCSKGWEPTTIPVLKMLTSQVLRLLVNLPSPNGQPRSLRGPVETCPAHSGGASGSARGMAIMALCQCFSISEVVVQKIYWSGL